jgi:hypothetical protein
MCCGFIQHRDAVLAVARALMIHRTLDAVMIHKIIASAPERARRADWARVQQRAPAAPIGRAFNKTRPISPHADWKAMSEPERPCAGRHRFRYRA